MKKNKLADSFVKDSLDLFKTLNYRLEPSDMTGVQAEKNRILKLLKSNGFVDD